MSVRSNKRLAPMRFVAPLACLAIMGYFAFHAFNGQYGIRAHLVIQAKTVEREAELEGLKAVEARFEHRVKLLSDGTMERDMVDEHLRSQLGMLHKNDIVLLH